MKKLAVALFNNSASAQTILKKAPEVQTRNLIDICAVTRNKSGSLTLCQAKDKPERYVLKFAVAGMLFGGIFSMMYGLLWPLFMGTAMGGLLGAIFGSADFGINNGLMIRLGSHMKPRTSALFILYERHLPTELTRAVAGENGILMQGPLGRKTEKALEHEISEADLESAVPDDYTFIHTTMLQKGGENRAL